MERDLTEQEKAVVKLREREKLSFRAIGERYGISPSKASTIYYRAQRELKIRQYRELWREQNQKEVSFPLTLGEAVVLKRILVLFQDWKLNDCQKTERGYRELCQDPEHLTAKALEQRLILLEQKTRKLKP